MEKKEMIKKLMEKVNDNIKKSNKEMMRLPEKQNNMLIKA